MNNILIYFNDLDLTISSRFYDLETVLDILSQREDISFLKKGIQDVSHYDINEGQFQYLDFTWSPNHEDFEKISLISNEFIKRDFIVTKIFKLERISSLD